MTCFGHLTAIRPSLQNSQYGTCSADNVHAIWHRIRLIYVLKYIKNGVRWLGFFFSVWCIKVVCNNKQSVGRWNEIKTDVYYPFKNCCIQLDYVVIEIHVCIFWSHKLLHTVWSSQGSWIVSLYAEFRMVTQTFLYLCSVFILFVWTTVSVFMYTLSDKNQEAWNSLKSRTGSDVTYSCHHNSSRFTFPIFVRSWRFSVLL